jgi:hypothetical protein
MGESIVGTVRSVWSIPHWFEPRVVQGNNPRLARASYGLNGHLVVKAFRLRYPIASDKFGPELFCE